MKVDDFILAGVPTHMVFSTGPVPKFSVYIQQDSLMVLFDNADCVQGFANFLDFDGSQWIHERADIHVCAQVASALTDYLGDRINRGEIVRGLDGLWTLKSLVGGIS